MTYKQSEIMRMLDLIDEDLWLARLSEIDKHRLAEQMIAEQRNPNHYDPEEGVRY